MPLRWPHSSSYSRLADEPSSFEQMAALLDEQGLHACTHHGALPSPQMLALLDEQGLLSFTFDEEGLLDAGAEIVREVPDELQALLLIGS